MLKDFYVLHLHQTHLLVITQEQPHLPRVSVDEYHSYPSSSTPLRFDYLAVYFPYPMLLSRDIHKKDVQLHQTHFFGRKPRSTQSER